MFSYTYPFDYSRVHEVIFAGQSIYSLWTPYQSSILLNPRSTFDINLTSLILKIQSLNDNRKSHYTKFWYYLLKKRYKKRDRLTNILKIQMFWFDPTKKVSTDPSRKPMLTIAS